MEVQPTRPTGIDTDVRAEKARGDHRPFAGSGDRAGEARAAESDANTRLSRPADQVDLSDEARELARREEEEADRRDSGDDD